jgi:hypothetical protein
MSQIILSKVGPKKMYTHFNAQNICLNSLLVIQICYTKKGIAATHVALVPVFKVPTISL